MVHRRLTWHYIFVADTVEPALAVTFTLRSASGSPEIAADTNNTLDSPVHSSHLSNKAEYYWLMGDCYRQVPVYVKKILTTLSILNVVRIVQCRP